MFSFSSFTEVVLLITTGEVFKDTSWKLGAFEISSRSLISITCVNMSKMVATKLHFKKSRVNFNSFPVKFTKVVIEIQRKAIFFPIYLCT